MKTISIWTRLLDLLAPRACPICGNRLAVTEQALCARCNLHLPRTGFSKHARDNEMAQAFWVLMPIERAAAMFFYEPDSNVSRLVHALKYFQHPELGELLGRQAAQEFRPDGFFEGIDAIVPVPLHPKRQRQRGYNQSMEIARGVSAATGLPVMAGAVKRISFRRSQTQKTGLERQENVENAFALADAADLQGKHLLVVDDVVTTGATVRSCCQELTKGGCAKVSVLSLGFTKS